MSKLKKKAFTIILGSMLCIMSCLPVFAAEPGISPHTEAGECPQCGEKSLYTHRTEVYEHDEYFPDGCYQVYEVTITSHCSNCGYSDSYSYHDHRRP